MTPKIAAVATSVPSHRFDQSALLRLAGYGDARRTGFFANSQVEGRHLYVDPDTFAPNESIDQLNARFRRGAVELGTLAVFRALERAGWTRESEKLGPLTFGQNEEYIFLGWEVARRKDYSEETARQIDVEIKRIIGDCAHRARVILEENLEKLYALARALLERESLDGAEVALILRSGTPFVAATA
jgi:hypothetical protein